MGTRGFIGFVVDGQEKIAYNHFDSYPSGLGLDVLKWLEKVNDFDLLKQQVQALRVVDDETPITVQDADRLKPWTDTNVGGTWTADGIDRTLNWYQLLRNTQGDVSAILSAGVIEDASEFPSDSLFAEWGYVIDLDAGVLEAYRGFQTYPHSLGRFAHLGPRQAATGVYYPVALVGSWPLFSPPSEEEFLSSLHDVDEDE